MICPFCLHEKTSVVDTRPSRDAVRRNRRCLSCDKRFTTYEVYTVSREGDRLNLHRIAQRWAKQQMIARLEGVIKTLRKEADD